MTWNPVKELKVEDHRNHVGRRRASVESGEGIERAPTPPEPPKPRWTWNPVKELKDVFDEELAARDVAWNPVKELKDDGQGCLKM